MWKELFVAIIRELSSLTDEDLAKVLAYIRRLPREEGSKGRGKGERAPSLGQLIKRRRKELGLTQEQLANLCGYDRSTIAGIETDRQGVSRDGAIRLEQALQLPPGSVARQGEQLTLQGWEPRPAGEEESP